MATLCDEAFEEELARDEPSTAALVKRARKLSVMSESPRSRENQGQQSADHERNKNRDRISHVREMLREPHFIVYPGSRRQIARDR